MAIYVIIKVMESNFEFIKKDKKLYNTIIQAEKLFKDGYFDMCIVQIRKFGEMLSKNVLGVRRTTEETFDDVIGTLSDIFSNDEKGKEFIEDLYYIKKQGNIYAHGENTPPTSTDAMECIKRAFEISIFYAEKNKWQYKDKYDVKLLLKDKIEEIKPEIEEPTDETPPDAKENKKVIQADFKNKKKVKNKKSAPKKKEKEVKSKEKTPPEKQVDFSKASFQYAVVFGALIVLYIAIMLFILPI